MNNMVTVRIVKLRKSLYNKKSSNTLRIGTHSKEIEHTFTKFIAQ